MPYGLVMGASGDIGQAICYALAEEGWSLYCHYHRNQEKVLSLVSDLRQRYPQQDFFVVSLNMLEESAISTFVSQLFQVDGIIFASGFTVYELLPEITSQQMDSLWQIHVKTPLLLLQQLQVKLAQNSRGRVVFISSVYGQHGSSMETVYSAVKGAQEGFVKAYAKEVATLGITVNAIAPGAVNTQMNQNWSITEKVSLAADIPLGRMAEPKEVAAACKYVCSKEAGYTTGTTLVVAGGWMD
ncbi:elongation factor P 5-aminopentanone reductase [Candidatus Enterococcus ferrettii]|uniref:3-oxoacyl-[acyl-carrier protein] reductase n=1 Tax=Candidatus Enterococcus ferrettii TaxID=2815324 RepID=A0ABV0ENL3_9ENTE|nr:SDR family oxidoreductase [Enterococcus sp. 665A]MBO1338996.1 SDR family oxidoreductase [Enterococcus sp. 665A]